MWLQVFGRSAGGGPVAAGRRTGPLVRRVPDGQAGSRVEELEVRGVDGQRDRRPWLDDTARGNPRGPQRFVVGQRDGLVVPIVGAGLGDAGVLHWRRIEGEDHVN